MRREERDGVAGKEEKRGGKKREEREGGKGNPCVSLNFP